MTTYDNETFKDLYIGFTVFCDNCDSKDIYVENSLGYSPESGQWGSIDFVCANCGQRTVIYGGF